MSESTNEQLQFPFNAKGYKTDQYVSPEYKVNVIARMLSGYDELTWNKLKAHRKKTYEHAAATLVYDWDRFLNVMQEFKDK